MRLKHLVSSLDKVQGLQNVRELPADDVLVFHNISDGDTFHNRNCMIPFDMAFLNNENEFIKVIQIYPDENLEVRVPGGTRTVLEANLNFFKN